MTKRTKRRTKEMKVRAMLPMRARLRLGKTMEVMEKRRRKSQLKIDKEQAMTVSQQPRMARTVTRRKKLKCTKLAEQDR